MPDSSSPPASGPPSTDSRPERTSPRSSVQTSSSDRAGDLGSGAAGLTIWPSVACLLLTRRARSNSDIRTPTVPGPCGFPRALCRPEAPAELVRLLRPSPPRFMHGVVGRGGNGLASRAAAMASSPGKGPLPPLPNNSAAASAAMGRAPEASCLGPGVLRSPAPPLLCRPMLPDSAPRRRPALEPAFLARPLPALAASIVSIRPAPQPLQRPPG